MNGTWGIKAGQVTRGACTAATVGHVKPYNQGRYLSLKVITVNPGGYKERWHVWDYGFEVRVLTLPQLSVWASAVVDLTEHGIPRAPDAEDAGHLALQVMEAAGLLDHDPASDHRHLLPHPPTEGQRPQ